MQCHAFSFETSQTVSKDWHYAHFWNPAMIVAGSTMPRYEDHFILIPGSVSNEPIETPSGDSVYPLLATDVLKSIYTFDSKLLIYLYLSNSASSDLPYGYKTFSDGKKQKGRPVVWIPPELRPNIHLPISITVIAPKKNLQTLADYVEKLPQKTSEPWLSMPEPPAANPLPPGEPLYTAHCASCHGEKGDGNGPASVFLYPKPRNFISGEFKLKSTLNTPAASDSDLYRTITHGVPGTAMPSWSNLTSDERWALVEYVKHFAISPKGPIHSIEEPKLPYRSPESRIATGEKLFFTKAKCNDCHGPSPKSFDNLPHGDGPSANLLVDDWGYPIHPADLASGTFKRGNSVSDLYLTITAGMPGTPMPPYQNNLSDEERWDIAVYISTLNKGHHGR